MTNQTDRLTCQICDRAIKANTGVIAHHGYQRPGEGWQTASCPGARALPYEVDRTILGKEVDMLDRLCQKHRATILGIQDESLPTALCFKVYDRQAIKRDSRYTTKGDWVPVTLVVTRDTLHDLITACEAQFSDFKRYQLPSYPRGYAHGEHYTFEQAQQHNIARVQRDLTSVRDLYDYQMKRDIQWVKKLTWNKPDWVPVS